METFYVNDTEFKIEDYSKNNFDVKSYDKIYNVNIISNTLNEIINKNYNFNDFIIIDDYFKDQINNNIDNNFIYYVNAKEENKNINTVLQIVDYLYKNNFNKSNKLIVIGGGITQDIGGFVAGIYKRGSKWLYIPTTLLAMTDSCIGGKVGVNHHSKNMLGMFVSPQKVIISDYFLKSLSDDMIVSGLGESLKLAIIGGLNEVNNFIQLYEKKDYLTIIKQSLVIKKAIIEYDELEKNERRVLNYGHTIGHAIEATTNFFVPHGIAVLFGMYYINKLFNINNFENINKYILDMIPKKYFIDINKEELIEHLKKDKKNEGNKICFIVPEKFGIFNIKFIELNDITDKLVNFII
jgi:3-dehydroquinate synthase